MSSSKEVFALRKLGNLDQAFKMAEELFKINSSDEWNIKAYAYCLNDSIKNLVSKNDYKNAQVYAEKLKSINIDQNDEILIKTVKKAIFIANPKNKITEEAKKLSFEKNDEKAYPLFKEALISNPYDQDLIKSFGWSLSNLLKKVIEDKDEVNKKKYLEDYDKIKDKICDDNLNKTLHYLTDLADNNKQIIRDAKEQSKKGNHNEALKLLKLAVKKFPNEIDLHENLAWELYKEKAIFEKDEVDVLKAKTLLFEYISLKNIRPSQIHSLFLRLADKLSSKKDFNYYSFIKIWNLSNLREEDYIPFVKDGKTYSSLGEKVIQHSAKTILELKLKDEVGNILPFMNIAIEKYKENIWLVYYKAKLLHLINKPEDAIKFSVIVLKEKITESWTWSLLAELIKNSNTNLAISCYCKALLCKTEEKNLVKIREHLAELLVAKKMFNEAKYEIKKSIETKLNEGNKVSDILKEYEIQEWFKSATDFKSNNNFYLFNINLAEEFVFQSLPWYSACVGESYTIPEKPDKPKRKLYIRVSDLVFDVSVSDKRFNISKKFKIGDAIQVKGELNSLEKFQVYMLDKRDSAEQWDILEWHSGNIIQTIKNNNNEITGYKVAVPTNKGIIDSHVSCNSMVHVSDFESGHPVSIKVQINKQHLTVISIRDREIGAKWDVYPKYIGIVDHINHEKQIAHFIVSTKIDGVFKTSLIKSDLAIGDKLILALQYVDKPNESYYTVLTANKTEQEITNQLTKEFKGFVNIVGNVGFADDVFIEAQMINGLNLHQDCSIQGVAIINFNTKKRIWGWKALIINNIVKNEEIEYCK